MFGNFVFDPYPVGIPPVSFCVLFIFGQILQYFRGASRAQPGVLRRIRHGEPLLPGFRMVPTQQGPDPISMATLPKKTVKGHYWGT